LPYISNACCFSKFYTHATFGTLTATSSVAVRL
jgi:hypothetical protein